MIIFDRSAFTRDYQISFYLRCASFKRFDQLCFYKIVIEISQQFFLMAVTVCNDLRQVLKVAFIQHFCLHTTNTYLDSTDS